MFSMFQTLVSGLQVLKKSYATSDHVKNIYRNLPAKWRPKFKDKSPKALQVVDSDEKALNGDSKDDSDAKQMAF
ncbi:hypothetical protein MTR_0040s0060 [Medicago truncatula]|uniref:Aspartyl-tRNA synthetase n=1 Tax=Medicago truncatula TaxID=3880 RepID=A0A072TI84_MEDTR|nr:hypothetical protein MTR_0040s0060 [Medicago truncatula]